MDLNDNDLYLQNGTTLAVLDRAANGKLPACQAPRLAVLEVDTRRTKIKCLPGISDPFRAWSGATA